MPRSRTPSSRLLRDYVGRGPTKARTIHSGKFVLCVLEDTMTKAERSLASSGEEDFVLRMRHAFQITMRDDLTTAVEALTHRKVAAFLSSNHIDPDIAAELFVLDEPLSDSDEASTSFDGAATAPDGAAAVPDGAAAVPDGSG